MSQTSPKAWPSPPQQEDDAPAVVTTRAPKAASRTRASRSRTELPAATPPDSAAPPLTPSAKVTGDFVTETEHPVLPIPFSATLGTEKLQGTALSVAAAYVAAPANSAVLAARGELATLQFSFPGFAVSIPVAVTVAASRRVGEATLQFIDPLGPHLPQLRHIINSHIAGDLVSLGGLLSYAGPTAPKAAKGSAEVISWRQRARSLGTAALSLALIIVAALLLLSRASETSELRPVFVEREAREMRATTAGQIAYLDPEADQGEVVFSINSNTGDVLNFRLPCECQVAVAEGISEGATVLPEDLILSAFEANSSLKLQTQISIEGLARAMNGDRVYLDMEDGTSLPVRVEVTSATTSAMNAGDLFVPVRLVPPTGVLGLAALGQAGRLRLASPWMPDLPF